jgi:hypothetical protein
MNDTLKRYTELPFVLEALSKRELTFLSPKSWDDKNDAYYVNHYRKKSGHGSLLAMCLTKTDPTYHHWRLFTHGASGAALYFKRREFESWIAGHPKLKGKLVEYLKEEDFVKKTPSLEDLPYIKRWAYRAEEEYRLLLPLVEKKSLDQVEFDLEIVEQVVLNPWMPESTYKAVKQVISSIEGCSQISVRRASMVDSSRWKSLAPSI